MELRTSTLELVATIGSGSKTTSPQLQESQPRAVAQTAEVAEMTSTKDVLIQILTQMETKSLMVLMVALTMHKIQVGVEATTPKSSCPDKCVVLAMVVIAAKVKKKTQLKKKIMKKRNKMTQLQVNALTQMVPSLIVMVMAAIDTSKVGVETTTKESSNLTLCAAFVAVVKQLAETMKKEMMK